MSLAARIRDPAVVTSLAPEELASVVLLAISDQRGRGQTNFHRDWASRFANEFPEPRWAVEQAILEAWQWLVTSMLIMPDSGTNGQNGWFILTRRGQEVLADPPRFAAYKRASKFPPELLHPVIAEHVWAVLARGEYDAAVFYAFRAVEEAVRSVGGFGNDVYGLDLMRDAFKPNDGRLTNKNELLAEQLALLHLFQGAIGSYKNPRSHRTVTLTDPGEAQEMVMLASHLLRIVDARRPAK